MRRIVLIILMATLILSGCARFVTVKGTFGDLFTVSVNFRGDLTADDKYYLVLSTLSTFEVPEDFHEFEEPCFVLWNDLDQTEKDYLLNRYLSWKGYVVVDAKNVYRVKGPFSTTEEAGASLNSRTYLSRAGDEKNLSFDFLVSDIFGSSLTQGQSVYFDIITTTHEAGGVYLEDRLDPSGNYIANEKNSIVSGSNEAGSFTPSLDILDWTVSIQ